MHNNIQFILEKETNNNINYFDQTITTKKIKISNIPQTHKQMNSDTPELKKSISTETRHIQ